MTPSNPPLLVFTGGHHSSALALARALMAKGWRIFWIGHRTSQWGDKSDTAEYREVTASGIDFFNLKAGKIYHTYHPAKLLRLPLGFIMAFYILVKLKLRYGSRLKGIVTFGGYLGVPVVFCGRLLGVPVIAHEQTVVAGWANKFIAFFARKIAVTWPTSLAYYPPAKVVLTGLPLRAEILKVSSSGGKIRSATPLIYITGGKQGSHVINAAVFSVLPDLLKNYTVIHQTGSSTLFNDYKSAVEYRETLPADLRFRYTVYDYLDPQGAADALSSAGLVVSRSGAHIIQELALLKTRCVLIPIPSSSHDEQLHNAELLAKNRQAVILPQSRLSGGTLLAAVDEALKLHPGKLEIITAGLENMVQLIEQEFV